MKEFTFDLDDFAQNHAPSMHRVCRAFTGDANRALVWWIRFSALKVWRARDETTAQLNGGSITLTHACELAASFPLNHAWEFEPAEFSLALEAAAVKRERPGP